MSTDWRETRKWTRLADGYIICPCCGGLTHPLVVELHASACYAIKQAMGEPVKRRAAPTEETKP